MVRSTPSTATAVQEAPGNGRYAYKDNVKAGGKTSAKTTTKTKGQVMARSTTARSTRDSQPQRPAKDAWPGR